MVLFSLDVFLSAEMWGMREAVEDGFASFLSSVGGEGRMRWDVDLQGSLTILLDNIATWKLLRRYKSSWEDGGGEHSDSILLYG